MRGSRTEGQGVAHGVAAPAMAALWRRGRKRPMVGTVEQAANASMGLLDKLVVVACMRPAA